MSIIPLKPSIQLPSYPQLAHRRRLDDVLSLLRQDSVRAHVRCFLCSFEEAGPGADVPFETFGPWAAEISFSLFLLAEYLDDGNDEEADLMSSLRCCSGWWTFIQDRAADVESIKDLCLDTLAVIDRVGELIPVVP